MGSDSYRDGQGADHRQSFLVRFNCGRNVKPLTREQKMDAAQSFLEHQVNSLYVQRIVEGNPIMDTVQTYEIRTQKIRNSCISHHLPPKVSIRINPTTINAELYLNNRRYVPKKK